MNAYDLVILPHPPSHGTSDNHGWCYGLPPGITPEQWPLDPNSGYPLKHGFTLLLPEDYRIHGPDIVGLSFFAADYIDDGFTESDRLRNVILHPGEQAPQDRELTRFWRSARSNHPRLSRMTGLLDEAYAVILLTQKEFDSPCFGNIPGIIDSPLLKDLPRPEWIANGVTFHRAIQWTPRHNDPNAGKYPKSFLDDRDTGYINYFDRETGEYKEWFKGFRANHIGGTMRPYQLEPPISPYYIEFGEYFGDYNFGGGNAQLDFKNMEFYWNCG